MDEKDTKKLLEIIMKGCLEDEELINEKEFEIAANILKDLNGTLAIRAIPILKFCIRATKYSLLNF